MVVYNKSVMAELSYSDVQRAVQDGLRNLQADVARLSNQVSAINQQSQFIDDIQALVQRLSAQITRIERQSMGHNPRTEMGTAQLTRDVQELKVRFAAVERFCIDMSKYIERRRDQELEDQQYRAA
jgi:Holliday junction resolvasome RuvABC endonuclease subunit